MSRPHLGLTWDHPRGREALRAAAARAGGLIEWRVQPLEGFESAPIAELAAAHDLLVLDHPHIGEAVAEDAILPLDALFPADLLEAWRRRTVGRALDSYVWGGRLFALPLDVAAQVMARRPDRIPKAPDGWDEVVALSHRQSVAPCLAGPHAVLTWMAIAASLGGRPGGEDLAADDPAREALAILRELYDRAPRATRGMNPIALLEHVASGEGPDLAPLVFGYVTYAAPGPGRLAFSDAPRGEGTARGSVLGGTGIALTRRAEPDRALLDHLAWLMEKATQIGFVSVHAGQPSARGAWESPEVNAAAGGFYLDTLRTVAGALVRPRFDGYVAFQTTASERLRDALAAGEPADATIAALRGLWRAARGKARGDLDDPPSRTGRS